MFVARVDFAYPDRRVAIELHGYAWHHSRHQWEKDQKRAVALAGLGWTYLPLTNRAFSKERELIDSLERVLGREFGN